MKADFDIAAQHYDATFTNSNIGKAQRALVYKHIYSVIQTEKKLAVLELNCGTGNDAIELGKLGHSVVATDISPEMITVAKAKSHPENVQFRVQDINTIDSETFDQKFDLIFSNFGGLNCLSPEQLETFLQKARKLLLPHGKVALVIMPKHTLWERFYFTLKGNSKKAKRRNTSESVVANVDGVGVKTWYYNPKEISALTENYFTTQKLKPIGLTIPPSYLENSIAAKFPLLKIFKTLDSVLTASSFARYADHFLIILEKR